MRLLQETGQNLLPNEQKLRILILWDNLVSKWVIRVKALGLS
jgi:hypothetical protein